MIKIVKGTYGYLDKNGIVKGKTSKDEPFSLSKEQEKRLVDLGVAVYIDEKAVETVEKYVDGAELDELLESTPGLEVVPEYNVEMKATELREIAKGLGLTFPVGTTKAEMVAEMDAVIDENMVDDDMKLPEFDPTEALE